MPIHKYMSSGIGGSADIPQTKYYGGTGSMRWDAPEKQYICFAGLEQS